MKPVPKLGTMQWLCWTWMGLTRNQREDVLKIMSRDPEMSPERRKMARKKLREMDGV